MWRWKWTRFVRSFWWAVWIEWCKHRGHKPMHSLSILAHANTPDEPWLLISDFYPGRRTAGAGQLTQIRMRDVLDEWEAWKVAMKDHMPGDWP